MLKDTKSLGNNKAPACESRGFVHKKRGVHFDTPPTKESLWFNVFGLWFNVFSRCIVWSEWWGSLSFLLLFSPLSVSGSDSARR
ncbi:hypothetical protein ABLT32_08145 [Bacteroides pyogenes]|uniref:hypothetical protein n=1 Tax=Bacteroides pyogenes TaxID=310300 RepID=UPI00165318BA